MYVSTILKVPPSVRNPRIKCWVQWVRAGSTSNCTRWTRISSDERHFRVSLTWVYVCTVRAIVISSYVHDSFVCPDGYLPDVSKARKVRIAPVKIAVRLVPRHSDSKQRKHNSESEQSPVELTSSKLSTMAELVRRRKVNFFGREFKAFWSSSNKRASPGARALCMYVTHVRERKAGIQERELEKKRLCVQADVDDIASLEVHY